MKRNCLTLTVLFVGCVLLLQIGYQGRTVAAEGAESELAVPEVNEPSPSGGRGEPAPKIEFEKVIHDFGEISPVTGHYCEFKFTNTGDSILKIKRVQATCDCTVPNLRKKEYAPGESGTLKIRYRSGKRAGPVTRHLHVYSNDKANPNVALSVKARIVLKVVHKPERLNLLLNKENAGCPEITLRSIDNQPFAIKQFKSTGDCIIVDVNSSVEATKFVLEPTVNPEKLRKGSSGHIEITLTHPKCKTVIIPFNALPEFTIKPPVIIVFNAEPQKPITRQVYILNNYDEGFDVESASSKGGIIRVLSQEKIDEHRYKFELQIVPPAAKDKQKVFSDVLFVNIKGGEKLEVTCRGFYPKNKKKVSSSR